MSRRPRRAPGRIMGISGRIATSLISGHRTSAHRVVTCAARRTYGNFIVTDNLATAASDYSPYSVTAPLDARLPGGGGYVVSGMFDVNPNKFGLVNNLVRNAGLYGNQTQ